LTANAAAASLRAISHTMASGSAKRMKISHLAGSAALFLLMCCQAQAQTVTQAAGSPSDSVVVVMLTVKGTDLVVGGDNMPAPPDHTTGGFEVGLKLPHQGLKAEGCDENTLMIGMPGIQPDDPDSESAVELHAAMTRVAYYNQLLAASKTDAPVTLKLVDRNDYLSVQNGVVSVRGCTTSFATPEFPAHIGTPPDSDGDDDARPFIHAVIDVAASSLVFDTNDGRSAPDPTGAFEIGVKLPVKGVDAYDCEDKTILALAMPGAVADDQTTMTPAQKQSAAARTAYYNELLKASKTSAIVEVKLSDADNALQKYQGRTIISYCFVNLEAPAGP
jgi:hypothetical protein